MTEKQQQKLIKKASLYIDDKKYEKAAKCLKDAYVENGKFNALIMYFFGSINEKVGNYIQSIDCLCSAVEYLSHPNNVVSKSFEYKIFFKLASACATAGMNKNAFQFYKEAYKRCEDDQKVGVFTSYLYTMIASNCSPDGILTLLSKANEFFLESAKKSYSAIVANTHSMEREDSKIRVVYISPDFRMHVMFNFYYALFKYYDKNIFHVTCIYLNDRQDECTEEIKTLVDDFKICTEMKYSEIADLIKSMQFDIAVDLAGYTANTGLPLFCYRIAPIQISGLGWMESTGVTDTDYLITDNLMDEPSISYITEKPLYMRSCFCYVQKHDLPASTHAPCTENGYITFGSFNRVIKMTNEMLIVWREILQRIPNSKLLIKSTELKEEKIRFFLLERLKKAGLNPRNVILEKGSEDYMTRYLDVDIALDTYPYTGGGTTFDALYMGVPVVSLYGKRRSSRFGLSILTNSGVGELAVATPEEYIERAVSLANDIDLLNVLHKNLRTMLKQSPAMDARGYVREMEAQYKQLIAEKLS